MNDGFEQLLVWQKAHELTLLVHRKIVPRLPPNEKWDLAAQIRRSSKSISANIAEGHGRFYFGDMVRFCYNARGSLTETENHLIDARDLEYIPSDLYEQAHTLSAEVQRLLNGFITYLKRKKPGADEPGHDIHVENRHVMDDEHPSEPEN